MDTTKYGGSLLSQKTTPKTFPDTRTGKFRNPILCAKPHEL